MILLTLCDHNSLLFPTATALQPSDVSNSPAVVALTELDFQWLRDTALHDCWLKIHTPPEDHDKSFESPWGWTWGFPGQLDDTMFESGKGRQIGDIFATTSLLQSVTSIYPKKVDV